MCHRVFIGSDAPLPTVDLTAGGGDFQVREVPDERGVRARIGVRYIVEAATEQECSCDFDVASAEFLLAEFPEDADEGESLARAVARARKLHGYITTAMRAGAIRVLVCEWEKEQLPLHGTREVDVEWFLRPDFDDADRWVLRVRP